MDDERETEDSKCLTIVLQKTFVGHQTIKHLFEEEVVDTEVTKSVFLEISIDGQVAGVLILGLYGIAAPNATENFSFLIGEKENFDDPSHTSEIGRFVQILANKYTKIKITNAELKLPYQNAKNFKVHTSHSFSHFL